MQQSPATMHPPSQGPLLPDELAYETTIHRGFWVEVTRAGTFINARACIEGHVWVGSSNMHTTCHVDLELPRAYRFNCLLQNEDPHLYPHLRLVVGDPDTRLNGVHGGWLEHEYRGYHGRHRPLAPGDVVAVRDYELTIGEPFEGTPRAAALASAGRCLTRAAAALEREDLGDLVLSLDAAARNVPDPELEAFAAQLRERFELAENREPPPCYCVEIDLDSDGEGPPIKLILNSNYDHESQWLDEAVGAQLDALRRALLRLLEARGMLAETARRELELLIDPTVAGLTVYMDWLQARGDPRGEFIALQLVGDLNTNAHARAEALLAAHGESWSSSFLGCGARVLRYRCGFPADVDASEASTRQLGGLGPYLRTLSAVDGQAGQALKWSRHFGRSFAQSG
jgi:hypothetical protein